MAGAPEIGTCGGVNVLHATLCYPTAGEATKPLGDGFIKLNKMLIAPIILVTVVHGIASMSDLKKVGRVGLKALIYFEVVTTLALAIGLMIGNVAATGCRYEC
jgi:aerobic C4-dicarboxylate transport protein